MGVGKIDVMSPGKTGVIIDVNPLEPNLPDDCLFAAQNAMHDPQMGEFGAIRKRLGQKQFNNASAVGAILGGIPMAVAGTGGAPALGGGGSTGTSTGTGNGTGSPGGTTEGSGVGNGSTTPGAGAYTGSSLFSGARLIAIGMDTNNTNDGYGWYITSKKMQNASIVATSPGPPGMAQSTGYTAYGKGKPCVLTPDGWFYYSLATSESTSGNTVTIRRTNGKTDQKVGTIPYCANPNDQCLVFSMAFGNNTIFVGVRDSIWNATAYGRIVMFDHVTFARTILGFPDPPGTYTVQMSVVPYAMTYDAVRNRLYFACNKVYTTLASGAGEIGVWGSPYGTSSTGGEAVALGAYNEAFCLCMLSYANVLYFGTISDSAGTYTNLLYGVGLTSDGSLTGTSAASLTGISGGDLSTYIAEGVAAYSGIYDLIYFKGKAYISWFNSGVRSAILSADQTTVDDTTGVPGFSNITSRWTGTSASTKVALQFFEDNGILYAIGSSGINTYTNLFLWSEDGVTWTNATATVDVASPTTAYPIPLLFGMNQA